MKERLAGMYHEPARLPTGLHAAIDGLDIDLDLYCGDIAGHVDTYLSGGKVSAGNLEPDKELEARFNEAEAKLAEYRRYKERYDAMARLLVECLSKDKG